MTIAPAPVVPLRGEAPPVRVVTAASLFDGHDAAINIMRRLLQARGAEVIHLGHDRSVEEIVDAAVQEAADAMLELARESKRSTEQLVNSTEASRIREEGERLLGERAAMEEQRFRGAIPDIRRRFGLETAPITPDIIREIIRMNENFAKREKAIVDALRAANTQAESGIIEIE